MKRKMAGGSREESATEASRSSPHENWGARAYPQIDVTFCGRSLQIREPIRLHNPPGMSWNHLYRATSRLRGSRIDWRFPTKQIIVPKTRMAHLDIFAASVTTSLLLTA